MSQTRYMPLLAERYAQLADVTAGTMLRVIPRVVRDGATTRVRLEVDIEDGSLGDQGSDSPVTRSTISTQAIVDVQQTLVIGGYHAETLSKNKQKVPVLGDVPVFGGLFRNESQSVGSRERLFLITPRIVGFNGTEAPATSTIAERRGFVPRAQSERMGELLRGKVTINNPTAAVPAVSAVPSNVATTSSTPVSIPTPAPVPAPAPKPAAAPAPTPAPMQTPAPAPANAVMPVGVSLSVAKSLSSATPATAKAPIAEAAGTSTNKMESPAGLRTPARVSSDASRLLVAPAKRETAEAPTATRSTAPSLTDVIERLEQDRARHQRSLPPARSDDTKDVAPSTKEKYAPSLNAPSGMGDLSMANWQPPQGIRRYGSR